MPLDIAVPGRALPGHSTPAYPASGGGITTIFPTKTQGATGRIRATGTSVQGVTAHILGISGTVNTTMFFSVVPDPGGCAELAITDVNGLTDGIDQHPVYTVNDAGLIIGLTTELGIVIACPVGLGVATVTYRAFEGGISVSGTLIATVTTVAGKLNAAWSSGTIAVQ